MTSAVLDLVESHRAVPLLGLPTEQPAKRQLSSSVDGVLRNVAALLDALVLDAVCARTRDDFERTLQATFPNYMRLLRSFSEVAATMPPQLIMRISVDSFDELESDLRSRGQQSFGAAMTERALFTVWTLRKITTLLHSIVTSRKMIDARDEPKDQDFAKNFLIHALIARFCVDCLVVAMKQGRTIYPEVVGAIDDRLRSVVDAYAWVEQAAELRLSKKEVPNDGALPPLDDEEKQLLNESMSDLARGEM